VPEQESEGLIERAKETVIETLSGVSAEVKSDPLEIKEEVKRALRRLFNQALERRPVIVPVIFEI